MSFFGLSGIDLLLEKPHELTSTPFLRGEKLFSWRFLRLRYFPPLRGLVSLAICDPVGGYRRAWKHFSPVTLRLPFLLPLLSHCKLPQIEVRPSFPPLFGCG